MKNDSKDTLSRLFYWIENTKYKTKTSTQDDDFYVIHDDDFLNLIKTVILFETKQSGE